ncbi:MAG: hypothetical protein K9L24_04435 [Spirochaetia bacterium]|nr:hypothetical protein [Spirochaetia bacterium]MCF7946827.1 hypothetical protein [Spirochaetia bacterium]MCF7952466.1 hypothetical protein [Spirochaetales bacterium]
MEFLLDSNTSWEADFGELNFTGFLDMYENPGKLTSFRSLEKVFPVEVHRTELLTSLGAFFGYTDIIPALELDVCFFGETVYPETENTELAQSETVTGDTGSKPIDNTVMGVIFPGSTCRNILGISVGKSSENLKFWYSAAVTDLLHEPKSEAFQLNSVYGRNPYVLDEAVPNTWYQSVWVFMKGDSQKVFFGYGRKWNLFERDQWWFETKASAENQNFQGEFSFFAAPCGTKSIIGVQDENLAILGICADIYPAKEFTLGTDWNYTVTTLSPWSKDTSLPGKIDWETYAGFNNGKKGKELGIELAYQYRFYSTYASGSKGISGETSNNMYRSITFAFDKQIKKLSLVSESIFYISRDDDAIWEKMEQSMGGELVFEAADCSITGNLDFEYEFGENGLIEFSTEIEYKKELSWGSFSLQLKDLKNFSFLCRIQNIDISKKR